MRLSDVLSKPPKLDYQQIDGFLDGKTLSTGKQRKIEIGKIKINFFCKSCQENRTFYSDANLYCIGVSNHIVSIDCVLNCEDEDTIQMWFLIESDGDIWGQSPKVRIIKRNYKMPKTINFDKEQYGDYSELLEKAQRAYRDDLGAGAIVYLRKIYEQITKQTAVASGIEIITNGHRKNFRLLLEEVDKTRSIIPREFSENGYKLFSELSEIIHNEYDEELALKKYDSLRRLVIGIIDNVRNNSELMSEIDHLGWNKTEGGF